MSLLGGVHVDADAGAYAGVGRTMFEVPVPAPTLTTPMFAPPSSDGVSEPDEGCRSRIRALREAERTLRAALDDKKPLDGLVVFGVVMGCGVAQST